MRGLQISTAKRDCFNPLTHSEYPNHHAHRISGPRSQIKDLLSASGFQPSLVRKSVDLLSDSGLRPSLVLKSKICSPLRASSPRLFASLSTCSPTRVFDPRLFSNQRFALRLGSSTLACSQTYGLLSASGFQPSLVLKPTVCSPLRASSPRLFASLSTCSPTRVFDPRLFSNQRFDRKPSVCLAEVVCFASNPPPLRLPLRDSPLANLRFALRLGSSTLACSQIKDLLSASGFQPSLVLKSKI